MKPNLLIVTDERQMGGTSILLENLIKLGAFDDFNTDVLVLHNNGDRLVTDKVNIIYGSKYFKGVDITLKQALKSLKPSLVWAKLRLIFDMKFGFIEKRIQKERKKLLTKNYDVEIAFKDGFTALFTIFGNSKQKIHWLQYEYKNCNPNRNYDKLFKRILPKFNHFIAVSNGVKVSFEKLYNIHNINVIPNIIDDKAIIAASKEEPTIKYDNNKINVILVGRMHPVKGYDRFLQVIKRLKDDNLDQNLNINILGDGEEKAKLLALKQELQLDVNFYGMVQNPYKEIKKADLLVLPSIYESFGLVALEAMILHTPVLATQTAAMDTIIKNGYNGIVVDNSENGLYYGLKEIIEDKEKLINLKNHLQNYTYNSSAIILKIKNKLKECYDEKIAR